MIRTLLAVFLVIVFSQYAAADWPDVYTQVVAGESVPLLELSNGDEGGTCSTVVFNAAAGYALTAGHCIEGGGFSYTVDGRDADVVRVNKQLDLAVVKSRLRKGAVNIPFAPAFPRVGNVVAVLGYPFGARSLTMQVGIVSNGAVDGLAWIDANLGPGDSGGAVLDAAGRLVAIAVGYRYNGPAHISRVVPIDAVRAFVADLLPQ
jgi:S1-C subfamily serine protease